MLVMAPVVVLAPAAVAQVCEVAVVLPPVHARWPSAPSQSSLPKQPMDRTVGA